MPEQHAFPPDWDGFPPDLSLQPDGSPAPDRSPPPVPAPTAPPAPSSAPPPVAVPRAPAAVPRDPLAEPRRRTGRLILVASVVVVVLSAPALVIAWLAHGTASRQPAAVAVTSAPAGDPSISATPSQPTTQALTSAAASAASSASPVPDRTRWGIYESTAPNGSSRSPSMVRVAGGELRIVGTGKNPTGAGNVSGGLCWCGTGGNRTYGKWQVRARFDAGAGYGPVIGLWPKSDDPHEGWISFADVPEAQRQTVHGYVAWPHDTRMSSERKLSGNFTGWHTYTVEWRATYVKMYVDTKLLYDSTAVGQPVVIPSTPMHLYMQQTAGPMDGIGPPDASTPNEVTMHVDWVRMYR